MAKDAFTTTDTEAEPVSNMLCAHALKLRYALDFYFAALQADWNYCAGRSRMVSAATAALAHAFRGRRKKQDGRMHPADT